MKVMVEISDEQVITVLRETIHDAIKGAPRADGTPATFAKREAALAYCEAANRVIEYLGGNAADLMGGWG